MRCVVFVGRERAVNRLLHSKPNADTESPVWDFPTIWPDAEADTFANRFFRF